MCLFIAALRIVRGKPCRACVAERLEVEGESLFSLSLSLSLSLSFSLDAFVSPSFLVSDPLSSHPTPLSPPHARGSRCPRGGEEGHGLEQAACALHLFQGWSLAPHLCFLPLQRKTHTHTRVHTHTHYTAHTANPANCSLCSCALGARAAARFSPVSRLSAPRAHASAASAGTLDAEGGPRAAQGQDAFRAQPSAAARCKFGRMYPRA